MLIAHYIGLLHQSCKELADAFSDVAEGHGDEPDIARMCTKLGLDSLRHAESLAPFVERYGEDAEAEPERLHTSLFEGARSGPLALLRDLHDLYLMATECDITWTLIGQAAQGLRDHELLDVVSSCEGDTAIHVKWLKTRMKAAAPQTLVVA